MKLLLLNDLHLASKGPSTRVDNWHQTVNRKLDFIEEAANAHHVDVIGIAGDLFHSPTMAFVSGDVTPMTDVTARLKRWSKRWPLLSIPGNHDERHNRLDLIDGTPFGTLLAAGILTPVWEHPYRHSDGSWVGGVPYPPTEENFRKWQDPAPGVLLVHAFGSMLGGDYFGEPIFSYLSIAQWAPGVVAFGFGHDHRDLGVEWLGPTAFIQVGALLRGTKSDDQITRQPKIVVIETVAAAPLFETKATCRVEVIDVPIEPAGTVFDLTKTKELQSVSDAIDTYVAELATVSTAAPIDGQVDQLDVPPAVRERVKAYLAKAGEAS